MNRQGAFWLWLAYVCFVVYGSLVPLDWQPLPLDDAWLRFVSIRLLDVGTQGRADWVANGVLYLPLGFLTANLLTRRTAGRPSLVAYSAAVLCGIGLAIGVEFLQLYFPPRTVSLNDLMAETLGGLAGATLALMGGLPRFRRLLDALVGDHDRLNARLLNAYLIAYAMLAIFPYDFVVSLPELSAKSEAGWGLWLAPAADDSLIRMLAKLTSEVVAAVPIGVFLAIRWHERRRKDIVRALVAGALVGFAIEGVQFFLVSGVSQGLSVLTRAGGVALGLAAIGAVDTATPRELAYFLRRHTVVVSAFYVLTLIGVNDWFSRAWLGWNDAQITLNGLHFLPFYYHYYTTEMIALVSLLAVIAMYAPIGLLTLVNGVAPFWAPLMATLFAIIIESSKLFLAGLHPDPTNLLIAAVAAWLAFVLAARMLKSLEQSPASRSPLDADSTIVTPAMTVTEPLSHALDRPAAPLATLNLGRTAILLLPALAIGWFGWRFPFHGVVLALGMVGYGALIWRRPAWIAFAIPVGLVALDLAPWSGWYFIDEFDLLMLVSLTVASARLPRTSGKPRRDSLAGVLWVLVGGSLLIGVARALFPVQMPEIAGLTPYFSPYNAVRIAKGAVWAFLLLTVFARLSALGIGVLALFGRGLIAGLTVVVTVVIWERAVFPGLFDFADVYRVTGPFSQMHVGGADLETYCIVAVPFLVAGTLASSRWHNWLAGLALFALTTYSVLVTFSRMAYLGYAVVVIVALLAHLRAIGRLGNRQAWSGRVALAAGLIVVGSAITAPILSGSFAQARFATMGNDQATRLGHWQDALKMRDSDWATSLFGMGIGRFPETHYWRSAETHAARFGLGVEGANRFLKLAPGSPLYLDQFVTPTPGTGYRIELRLRSENPNTRVTASLCEKWLLTSARCDSATFEAGERTGWTVHHAELSANDIGTGIPVLGRTVKFSLNYSAGSAVADVDDVRLLDAEGHLLLANGDFSHGFDRWFFSIDNDLPWHTWSLPVGLLFDQGWFGLIAAALMLSIALRRVVRAVWTGHAEASALLGALIGIAMIGSVNTVIDSPRLLLLTLMLMLFGLIEFAKPSGQQHRSRSASAI